MSNVESKKGNWLNRLTSINTEVQDAEWHNKQMKKKFVSALASIVPGFIMFVLAAYVFYDINAFIALTFAVTIGGGLASMVLVAQGSAHNHQYMMLRD